MSDLFPKETIYDFVQKTSRVTDITDKHENILELDDNHFLRIDHGGQIMKEGITFMRSLNMIFYKS